MTSGTLPGWQLCRGISGSIRVEWVAGFVWNQWLVWSGIRRSSQIDLELLYKFTVSRSVYSGQRPAVGVLGYENLNKDKLELVRFGHQLDGTTLSEGSYGDELENLGDVDLDTIGQEFAMGISVMQFDSFVPELVLNTDKTTS